MTVPHHVPLRHVTQRTSRRPSATHWQTRFLRWEGTSTRFSRAWRLTVAI